MRTSFYVLCWLLAGCASWTIPREFVLSELSRNAEVLSCFEVSIESLERSEDEKYRMKLAIAKGFVDEAQEGGLDTSVLQRRSERIVTASKSYKAEIQSRIDELKVACDAKSDFICYYHIKRGLYQEDGWVVVRGQSIVKKVVLNIVQQNP